MTEIEKILPAGGVFESKKGQHIRRYTFLHEGPCIHRNTQNTNRIIASCRAFIPYCDTKKGKRKARLSKNPLQPW